MAYSTHTGQHDTSEPISVGLNNRSAELAEDGSDVGDRRLNLSGRVAPPIVQTPFPHCCAVASRGKKMAAVEGATLGGVAGEGRRWSECARVIEGNQRKCRHCRARQRPRRRRRLCCLTAHRTLGAAAAPRHPPPRASAFSAAVFPSEPWRTQQSSTRGLGPRPR